MNIHTEINLLRAKYRTPETSEALQAGLHLFQEYIKFLESSIKEHARRDEAIKAEVNKNKLKSLQATISAIMRALETIASNPTATAEELAEAKVHCKSKLDTIERIMLAI